MNWDYWWKQILSTRGAVVDEWDIIKNLLVIHESFQVLEFGVYMLSNPMSVIGYLKQFESEQYVN